MLLRNVLLLHYTQEDSKSKVILLQAVEALRVASG
jgi:hypothetical protein